MTERQIQFRVGIFVIVAVIAAIVMVFQFGEFQKYLQPKYTISIHFRSAPGITVATPVRRNGVLIGSVTAVQFDDRNGGVVVKASIEQGVRLWPDGHVRLSTSLLGDSAVEFLPGRSDKKLKDGDTIEGEATSDALNVIGRMEQNLNTVIDSFHETSREWQGVGHNLNRLLETNQGNLHVVVERAADALAQVTQTMKLMDQTLEETSRLVADPRTQENLRRTLAALPQLTAETQKTIAAIRMAVQKVDQNMQNLGEITAPLSKRSVTMATHLENTLTNLETLSGELAQFTKLVNGGDGSIRKLASDPQLYTNLNRSAESLSILLQNIEPIVHDLRIFSDKVARHPELIGVSGALRGSSGLKEPDEGESGRVTRGTRRP